MSSNGAEYIRRELMIRLVRAFDAGTLAGELDQIPIKIRPRSMQSSRCCIYHDRAVLKYRLMALLGISCEDETDESKTLAEYFKDMPSPKVRPTEHNPLSVCAAGCSGCPDSAYVVTGNCRGCFARPCVYNCPKGAISVVNQVSTIDHSKCIKCGKCLSVCPFGAITKTRVPCEDSCPVGAIRKNDEGTAEIDFEKCIFCGKCFNACPFSAIMERSSLLHVLEMLKDQTEKVVAMVAPSAMMQFPGTLEQLFSAVSKLGFADVVEVALGAEMTIEQEAAEFKEHMEAGKPLMTNSCCPAYVELVKKHLPSFLEYVSSTPSPMAFTARMVKEKDPQAKAVFIGPCIAKRVEAQRIPDVDCVLSFEELGVVLAARGIDVIAQEPYPIPRGASTSARNFAKSCGVSRSILEELMRHDPDFKLEDKFINGIDKKTLGMLKLYAAGKLKANFLEVMGCTGGCINGPCSLVKD